MGYIAPVTNYQYNQYAERDIGNKIDPRRFIPVSRVNTAMSFMEFHHLLPQIQHREISKSKSHEKTEKPHSLKKKKIDKAYNELTGKGRFFSEYI